MRMAAADVKPLRTGRERKLTMNPSRPTPRAIRMRPTMTARVAASPMARAGSPSASSASAGGGEQRADGGRPDTELAGPADGGVGHQGQDGGIQPDLGRQPGQERVAHALRDEHRPHGEPGDEVALQVLPGVAGHPIEHRQPDAAPAGRDGPAVAALAFVTSHPRVPPGHYIATGAHAQTVTPRKGDGLGAPPAPPFPARLRPRR